MSGDREQILGRIAEALAQPAPPPHGGPEQERARAAGPPPVKRAPSPAPSATAPFREWLPPVGENFPEQHALFAHQCAALKTELHDAAGIEAAAATLASLAAEAAWKKLALHAGPLTDALAPLLPPGLELLRVERSYDPRALEACDAGLTECECLIAQTGSVCVTSRSSGGRALSVLPPHHVVLARRQQMLPDLTAAYRQLAAKYQARPPSFICFISGPSRTGDIERILVLGAHGPRRLTILLLE